MDEQGDVDGQVPDGEEQWVEWRPPVIARGIWAVLVTVAAVPLTLLFGFILLMMLPEVSGEYREIDAGSISWTVVALSVLAAVVLTVVMWWRLGRAWRWWPLPVAAAAALTVAWLAVDRLV